MPGRTKMFALQIASIRSKDLFSPRQFYGHCVSVEVLQDLILRASRDLDRAGSLHIREKSAARSTIFLVCGVRQAVPASAEARYWEEVEPTVRQAVRAKVKEFQEAGIGGIDLYLACFGPALQVF